MTIKSAVELIKQKKDVIIFDNLANSSPKVLDRIEQITGVKPTFFEGDICCLQDLEKVFTDHKIIC